MILTEGEASERRCTPFAVVQLLGRDERDGLVARGELSFNCIGSACMQWRQVEKVDLFLGKQATGYCGLAGKP